MRHVARARCFFFYLFFREGEKGVARARGGFISAESAKPAISPGDVHSQFGLNCSVTIALYYRILGLKIDAASCFGKANCTGCLRLKTRDVEGIARRDRILMRGWLWSVCEQRQISIYIYIRFSVLKKIVISYIALNILNKKIHIRTRERSERACVLA